MNTELVLELATVSEVLKYAKKAKKIMVWSDWSQGDGDYFKVEKKYFVKLMEGYKNNCNILPKYARFSNGVLWMN